MKEVRCPICHREMKGDQATWPEFPFCSDRCRRIDLGRWLGEAYRIPTSTPDEAEPDGDPTSSSEPV